MKKYIISLILFISPYINALEVPNQCALTLNGEAIHHLYNTDAIELVAASSLRKNFVRLDAEGLERAKSIFDVETIDLHSAHQFSPNDFRIEANRLPIEKIEPVEKDNDEGILGEIKEDLHEATQEFNETIETVDRSYQIHPFVIIDQEKGLYAIPKKLPGVIGVHIITYQSKEEYKGAEFFHAYIQQEDGTVPLNLFEDRHRVSIFDDFQEIYPPLPFLLHKKEQKQNSVSLTFAWNGPIELGASSFLNLKMGTKYEYLDDPLELLDGSRIDTCVYFIRLKD